MRNASSLALGLFATLAALSADDPSKGRLADQAALKAYNDLIGDWRGVGQVKRFSNKGAWTENASWAWRLSNDSAAIELKADKGKYLKSGLLHPGPKPGQFSLDATLADGSKRSFRGEAGKESALVLKAEGEAEGLNRVTITPRHGTRLLVLLESRDASGAFERLGEVGYTRVGIEFAAGDTYPVCIVTEGRGTIAVTHQGKTYYVCCSGCKDLFNDDPAAVIAEYEAKRKAKERAK